MHIVVLGLDHHTSPIEIREQLAFRPDQLAPAFEQLVRRAGAPLSEAVILSTCNRVELYGVALDPVAAQQALTDFLYAFHLLQPGTLEGRLYCYTGIAAVEHLFATACGLNSQIIGEPQIQSQIRAAAAQAHDHHVLGPITHALFRHAVEVGKRARTETDISRYATSISHAGVELARRLLGDLRQADVLLVGSGKISELAAKNLIDNGARSITLVNRTFENAQALAGQWGGQALPYESLPQALATVDVVLTSTAAPHVVIDPAMVRGALEQRPARPLLLIDLAVPRDIDPRVAQVAGAHVYDIDDLQEVVSTNVQRRREELVAVQRIVQEELPRFTSWLQARTVVPTLNRLREQADLISRNELERAMRRLPTLDQREREVIESLAAGIVNKLLHQPTIRLKQEASQGNGAAYAAVLQHLFGLES